MNISSTTLAREYVFRFLCFLGNSHFLAQEELEQKMEDFNDFEEENETEINQKYSQKLIEGVNKNYQELSTIINDKLRNKNMEKLDIIVRSILLISTFELIHTKTPPKVVINEGVKMAQKYGDERCYALVNGVLDSVRKI